MILLTKEINEQLDLAKLPELTVMRTDAGTLSLVGRECGKEIMNFSSMPISKKLTSTERGILLDDYVLPVLHKHKKDLISLITLMKDQTLEEELTLFKKDTEKSEDVLLDKSSHYNHTTNLSEQYMYNVTTNTAKKFHKGNTITYYVEDKKYEVNLATENKSMAICLRAMKDAEPETIRLSNILEKWIDKNEAVWTKANHTKKLQESMKIKCSL